MNLNKRKKAARKMARWRIGKIWREFFRFPRYAEHALYAYAAPRYAREAARMYIQSLGFHFNPDSLSVDTRTPGVNAFTYTQAVEDTAVRGTAVL